MRKKVFLSQNLIFLSHNNDLQWEYIYIFGLSKQGFHHFYGKWASITKINNISHSNGYSMWFLLFPQTVECFCLCFLT